MEDCWTPLDDGMWTHPEGYVLELINPTTYQVRSPPYDMAVIAHHKTQLLIQNGFQTTYDCRQVAIKDPPSLKPYFSDALKYLQSLDATITKANLADLPWMWNHPQWTDRWQWTVSVKLSLADLAECLTLFRK